MAFPYPVTAPQTDAWDLLTLGTLQDMGAQVANFLPRLLVAVVVVLIGVLVANLLERLARQLLVWTRIEEFLRKTQVPTSVSQGTMTMNIADVVAFVVKWFVLLLTFASAADVLRWLQVSRFFAAVIEYVPNIVVAVLLVGVGFLISQFVYNLMTGTGSTENPQPVPAAMRMFAGFAKWAIMVFVSMAALVQLGIAESLIHIAFFGLVAMLTIAGGLAFGLGGRDKARQILDEIHPPKM